MGAIGSDVGVSPLAKPEYDGVITGTVLPTIMVGLEAVIVSCGSTTLVEPGVGVEVTEKSLQFEPVPVPSGSLTRLSPSGMLGENVEDVGNNAVRLVSVTVGTTPYDCTGQLCTKSLEARSNALVA